MLQFRDDSATPFFGFCILLFDAYCLLSWILGDRDRERDRDQPWGRRGGDRRDDRGGRDDDGGRGGPRRDDRGPRDRDDRDRGELAIHMYSGCPECGTPIETGHSLLVSMCNGTTSVMHNDFHSSFFWNKIIPSLKAETSLFRKKSLRR